MRILGIHSGHGCGVALIEDGRCVYAASEERFARKKVIFGFPKLALTDCLRYMRLQTDQIDRVALSVFNPVGKWRALTFARLSRLRQCGWRTLLLFDYPNEKKPYYVKGLLAVTLNLLSFTGVPTVIAYWLFTWWAIRCRIGWRTPIGYIGHHESHAIGAAYLCGIPSPFSVVSEGYDGEASLKYDSFDADLVPERLSTTYLPHSPGEFYNCPTIILGYNPHKHCGKITGLAAYGDPKKLLEKVRALAWVEAGELRLSPKVYLLCVEYAMHGQLPEYFRGDQPQDIAAAFQQVLEETQMAAFEAGLSRSRRTRVHICLSGGTFANVRLNQRFLEHPQVESVMVMPPMSDEGQPLGAAIVSLQAHDRRNWRPHRLEHVFLGPGFTEDEMHEAIQNAKLNYARYEAIEPVIARLLHEGKIVARFNGRMEFGPRALGNRSILARAIDPSVNDWLNKRLQRTEFMPFAPCVLDSALDQLFTGPIQRGRYTAEFMTITFDCSPWMKKHCPAVVHLDGTARPQVVTPISNPSLHRILTEYERLSGLPVLINTSFNMHEEPIVCTPTDAVRAFQRGHLDVLAMGPYLVVQNP